MSKNTVRMYLLTSFVGGVGGIIFLGVALYSTQLLIRTLAFIAGAVCYLQVLSLFMRISSVLGDCETKSALRSSKRYL